jgi:predicted DNA-binding transcriptional regulator AlpA
MSRLLRVKEVIKMTSLSETSIYRRASEGTFPKPIKLNPPNGRSSAWISDEVEQWIEDRIAASRNEEAA